MWAGFYSATPIRLYTNYLISIGAFDLKIWKWEKSANQSVLLCLSIESQAIGTESGRTFQHAAERTWNLEIELWEVDSVA